MKDKLMKVKNKVKLAFLNAAVAIGSVGTGLYVGMAQACATQAEKYTVDTTNVNFNDLQGRILGLVFMILRIVGVVWCVMGISKVVGALKDDRPEDIKGGIASAIAGAALAIAPTLLGFIGITVTKG